MLRGVDSYLDTKSPFWHTFFEKANSYFSDLDTSVLAMGTIAQNHYSWNVDYDWKNQGNGWSKDWGGVEMQ